MAVRATQQVIASLSIVGAAHTQASQIVVAAMVTATAPVRASAIQIDALFGHPIANPSRARASWLVIEAIVWSIDPWTGKPATDEAGMPVNYPVLPGLTFSVIKRPRFFNATGVSASGREVRQGYAASPLWEWDLTYDYLPDKPTSAAATPSDLKELLGFFLAQNGGLFGFWFSDPDDHTVTGQAIGVGNNVLTNFVLVRTYGGASGTGTEPIGGVNLAAPFHVYINGALQDPAGYDIVTTVPVAQVLRFHVPPVGGVITVDMDFTYFCRFKEDTTEWEKFMDKLWSQRMVTLTSLRG
jgi:hypothetical protein